MKLKNKLISILGLTLFIILFLEIFIGNIFIKKYFKIYKIKSLEKINFIENNKINYKKLEEYKITKNAQVEILDKNNNKFINLSKLSYFTLKTKTGVKIILLSPYLNKLYMENKINLKKNSNLSIKTFKILNNYYLVQELIINKQKIKDFDIPIKKSKIVFLTGKIMTIPRKNIEQNSNEILENFYSNKNQVLNKIEGPYRIIVSYKFKPIEELFPPLVSYLITKTIVLIILIFLLGIILQKKLINPIITLSKNSNLIGQLNFKLEMKYKGNDEIGDLYKDIEKMSFKLENIIKFYKKEMKNNLQDKIEFEEELKLFMHEIKTPLTAIIGFSDIYLQDKENKYISIINNEGKKILRLANELIERKNVTNEIVLKRENFNISELIELILKIYEKELKNISVIFQRKEDIFVIGDREKIEQVIGNLLKNAIEHTKDFIKITLNVSQKIEFSIENNGNKIENINIDKLWQKYYSTNEDKNRGLGLYICATILKLHRSSYKAFSTDTGIKFIFTLDKGYKGDKNLL